MKSRKKISFIFGTRPEAIKLAPVILLMKSNPYFECEVCVTAQHREMLDQVLQVFDIVPNIDLNVMKKDQSLASLTDFILKLRLAYFFRAASIALRSAATFSAIFFGTSA